MSNNPILVVDDDPDDLATIRMVAEELKIINPLVLFQTGSELMDYLHSAEIKPALIICDINMPGQNGYEVKKQLDADDAIPYKHISFVYLTTSAADDTIKMAARLAIQGCYTKPSDYRALRQTIETIFKRFT